MDILSTYIYFKVFVGLEWILFQLLSFVYWCLNKRFLFVFWNFHFLSRLPLSRSLSQPASRQFLSIITLVAERHLALASSTEADSIPMPCLTQNTLDPFSLEEPVSGHHSHSLTRTEKESEPIMLWLHVLLSRALPLLSTQMPFCIWVSMCFGFLFLHLACDPQCLKERGIFKVQTHHFYWCEHLPLFHHQDNSFILSLPSGMWFIQASHFNISRFLFSFSVKKNWGTWPFSCSKTWNTY